MLVPTIIMGAIAALLLVIGYMKGNGQHVEGMRSAVDLSLQVVPLLFFAFIVAGMIQSLVPREFIVRWIGETSGMRGIFIGTFLGGIAPGGPYVSLPLVAAFIQAGASAGTMVAFLTAWSLWAVSRLPMEVGILGWKFTLIRLACTFFFPPVAGLIAQLFFSKVNFSL
ncbi:MAG: permease [Deltaproteobacteria bacterium]|nr:permease [Deltaproteobacteria bacterium]